MTSPYHVTISEGSVQFRPLQNEVMPPILRRLPSGAIPVPTYLEPWDDSAWRLLETDGNSSEDLLSDFEKKSCQLGGMSLIIDRVAFLDELEQMMEPDEFILGFGLYTSTIENEGVTMQKASSAGGRVIHGKVRADFEAIFAKGNAIIESLPEAEQEDFLNALCDNFAVGYDKGDGVIGNSSMYLARNTLFDLIARPNSIVDPSAVLAVRLLKTMVQKPDTSWSVKKEFENAVTDPRTLVSNPEVLFMLDDFLSALDSKAGSVNRGQMERICIGVVSELMRHVREVHAPDSYPVKLADAYFAIGERQLAQLQLSSSRQRAAEKNVQYMPQVLVGVAHLVAKGAPEDLRRFHEHPIPRDYSLSFDYLLPFLKIEKLWPEIEEPATIETIKKAYSRLIHKMDEIYR